MGKIVMLKGLPASGKSTLAKEMLKSGGNYYRVNRDLLREMLFFSDWRGSREELVVTVEMDAVHDILMSGASVIIDDTNLSESHDNMWREYADSHGAKFEIIIVDTPLDECIARDEKRDKKVGKSVIVGLAMQNGLYSPQKAVLCDLDGTMADLEHRLHYVHPKEGELKDWKSFFAEIPNDSLIEDVAAQVADLIDEDTDLFYISARPENYRKETEEWLERVGAPKYKALFMRRAHDKREDSLIKSELLHRYFPDKSIIKCVFDDRPRVIRMWREEGLEVIDCGSGEEF